jgi:hypothetical protein
MFFLGKLMIYDSTTPPDNQPTEKQQIKLLPGLSVSTNF